VVERKLDSKMDDEIETVELPPDESSIMSFFAGIVTSITNVGVVLPFIINMGFWKYPIAINGTALAVLGLCGGTLFQVFELPPLQGGQASYDPAIRGFCKNLFAEV
jgi:hypothetical protein